MKLRELIDCLEQLSNNGGRDNIEVFVGSTENEDFLVRIENVYPDFVSTEYDYNEFIVLEYGKEQDSNQN